MSIEANIDSILMYRGKVRGKVGGKFIGPNFFYFNLCISLNICYIDYKHFRLTIILC